MQFHARFARMSELLPIDTGLHRAKLTAKDFLLLDRNGAFAAYRKTELIDGDIYFVNAQHRPHGIVKTELYDALRDVLKAMGSPYRPVQEFSLALSPTDTPEPDVMLTSEPRGKGVVPLASVPLVIEVSDSTLDMDLGKKAAQYAAAGVPEYWVADVNARVIHQMWEPAGDAYTERNAVDFGTKIAAETIEGVTVDTSAL
jgi:Uma2 family endonuclease